MNNETIKIFDIPFTTLKEGEILSFLAEKLTNSAEQIFLATPNPEILLASKKDAKFKAILQQTDLNIPDGNGIIWANYYLEKVKNYQSNFLIRLIGLISIFTFLFHRKNEKNNFQKAIHGSDLMLHICSSSEFQTFPIFLLGNQQGLMPNTAQLTAQKLKERYPQIKIAGYFDSTPNNPQNLTKIQESQAKIIFVAFGAPYQEKWIAENYHQLPQSQIFIGVGGTFDFISGIIPRAPLWLRKIGLEWLYRLIRQPQKRFKRIINAFLVFPYQVIKQRTKQSK